MDIKTLLFAIFGCLTIRYDAALPFIVLWFSLTNQILIPKAVCVQQSNLCDSVYTTKGLYKHLNSLIHNTTILPVSTQPALFFFQRAAAVGVETGTKAINMRFRLSKSALIFFPVLVPLSLVVT